MSFHIQDDQNDDSIMSEINMTPMVDVMLVLLIIFIITLPVIQQAVKVELPKANSVRNEVKPESVQLSIDANGQIVTLVQVAGLIARRILCYIHVGDRLTAGERYGFIRFGSRVDVYLPLTAEPLVCVGDKVFATNTALARLPGLD